MLRVVAHKSAAAAHQYYTEGLKREDYYSEGQEVVGKWYGKAAELLGVSGAVTSEGFAALVENRHPVTGKQLTPRTKADRIVGYDLNFHAPKSLSVLYALTGNEKILTAFRESVAETMSEIEWQAATRIRRGGAHENRITGNLAWAEFVHFTARPVGGVPDPHLHVHCFTFNATFDDAEGRWKAAKFRDIKRDAPYSEAGFHARLTHKLDKLGFGIERTAGGWEVAGMPASVNQKFSRRTAQIEELAQQMGVTDAREKDALGASSREGKRKGLSFPELLGLWGERLTDAEKVAISRVAGERRPVGVRDAITAKVAFDYALEKLFAKNSVVDQKRLVAEALRFGVGRVTPEEIWDEFERRPMISRQVNGEFLCTTVEVLQEEISLIRFARLGRGKSPAFVKGESAMVDGRLSDEQRAAVRHILKSHDQVIAIRGGAGVGKTTMMKEAVAGIEKGGVRVFAFAPSAAASRETLREAGFAEAETVAHLLANAKLQMQTRGQVIWIDEAGLLGAREMWEVMRIAGSSTRVILTGDSGQHAPVARGDAFRLLQQYAGLKVVELSEIRRQEVEGYKQAVAALSRGDLQTAFRRLDDLGAIIEVADDGERYRLLASDFLALSRKGAPPLVVSPTHAESRLVTDAIRAAKAEIGQLKGERSFVHYHNLQWEEVDRGRAENYRQGLMVQFHQNAAGVQRGEMLRVTGVDETGKVLVAGGKGENRVLNLAEAKRFQVFEEREIALARGDRIRITRNGQTADGRRISNGNLFTIEKFNRSGDMVLSTGAVLSKNHGHLAYGYCQTSHSSQSKSVRDVLVAQSEVSFLAGSLEQFYVSVSRGKETVRVYTDDRTGLQEGVGNHSWRRSGIELASMNPRENERPIDGKNWQNRLESQRKRSAGMSETEKLNHARKGRSPRVDQGMSWRKYIEMKKAMSGPDGKSRSKGFPGKASARKVKVAAGGLPEKHPKKATAKAEKPVQTTQVKPQQGKAEIRKTEVKAPETRKTRLGRAYQVGQARLQQTTQKVKKLAGERLEKVRALRQSNTQKVSEHAAKQRAANATKTVQTKAQVKQPQVPPPAAKRGK